MKILVFYPEKHWVARFYRGSAVLERMRDPKGLSFMRYNPKRDLWEQALGADVALFVRNTMPDDYKAMLCMKDLGIKTWYDLDDDYLNVPLYQDAFPFYQAEPVREAVKGMMKDADYMTVSTPGLKEAVEKHRKGPIEIIPNSLDEMAFKDIMEYPHKEGDQLKYSWRGGESHDADLEGFRESFLLFHEKAPKEVKFIFLGHIYWQLFFDPVKNMRHEDRIERFHYGSYVQDFYKFVLSFREKIHPHFHFVPLINNEFNRSKSCISAIEGIYAGAIPIVPAYLGEEWAIPGALQYNNPQEAGEILLKSTRAGYEEHKMRWMACAKWVKKNRLLSKANAQRLSILKRLGS